MNVILILLAAMVVLILGCLLVGRALAKSWGIDPARETPSQDCFDGKDFVPTPPVVVMGHHFASVAGAGTIFGSVMASSFGWGPVLLWIVVGSVFFGAAHDFGALFASLRHKGRSLGRVLRECVGEKTQRVFTAFSLLVLVLLIACLTNITADTFASASGMPLLAVGAGQVSPQAGAGTASILFVLVGLLFGLLVFRKNLPMIPMTILCLLLMAGSVWAGMHVGLNLNYYVWVGVIALYLIAAALLPVWSLLQPRDFLSAVLLWAVMLLGFVAVIGAALSGRVEMDLPFYTGFSSERGPLVPMLFVIIAGGAVSGYHALICSGTTAKQLANEKHARSVSVGSVLLDALLALLALMTAGVMARQGNGVVSPIDVFASGLATMWSAMFGGDGSAVTGGLVYSIAALTVSVFTLTTLDTCTRLARYLFAELFNPDNRRLKKLEGAQRFFATPAVGTILVVLLGCGLGLARETDRLWGLFGASNLLLAGLAMLAVAVWLKESGKKTAALAVPMLVLLVLSVGAFGFVLVSGVGRIAAGAAGWVDWLALVLALLLLALGFLVMGAALPALFGKKQPENEEE